MILFSQTEVKIKNFVSKHQFNDDIPDLYTWNHNEVEISNNKYVILINRKTYFPVVIPFSKELDLNEKFNEIMDSYSSKLLLANLGIKLYLFGLNDEENVIFTETRDFSDALRVVKASIEESGTNVAGFDNDQLAQFAFEISKEIRVASPKFGQINAFSSFILTILMDEEELQFNINDVMNLMESGRSVFKSVNIDHSDQELDITKILDSLGMDREDNEGEEEEIDNDHFIDDGISEMKVSNAQFKSSDSQPQTTDIQKQINNDMLNQFKNYLASCGDSVNEINLKLTYVEDYVNFYLLEQHNENITDDFDMLYFYFTAFMPAQHIYLKKEPLALISMQQFFEFLFKYEKISQTELKNANQIFDQIKKKFDLK